MQIDEADSIEVSVDAGGKIWINVDGVCCIRANKAKLVEIDDRRAKS